MVALIGSLGGLPFHAARHSSSASQCAVRERRLQAWWRASDCIDSSTLREWPCSTNPREHPHDGRRSRPAKRPGIARIAHWSGAIATRRRPAPQIPSCAWPPRPARLHMPILRSRRSCCCAVFLSPASNFFMRSYIPAHVRHACPHTHAVGGLSQDIPPCSWAMAYPGAAPAARSPSSAFLDGNRVAGALACACRRRRCARGRRPRDKAPRRPPPALLRTKRADSAARLCRGCAP